jgi:hypothetical protein
MRLLEWFVTARFWLDPAFIVIYYAQVHLPGHPVLKHTCLAVLLTVLSIAIAANVRWIPDYGRRLVGGVAFLRAEGTSSRDEKQLLEQMRWSNAKMLAIVGIILAVLVHYDKVESLREPYAVPAIIVVLLILVALFDAALDLEAEWTISVLSALKEPTKFPLPHAIWKTNQFRDDQISLLDDVRAAVPSTITFRAFSSTAQNLISFAILVVGGTTALVLRLVYLQW